jgi:hypothetical protein
MIGQVGNIDRDSEQGRRIVECLRRDFGADALERMNFTVKLNVSVNETSIEFAAIYMNDEHLEE